MTTTSPPPARLEPPRHGGVLVGRAAGQQQTRLRVGDRVGRVAGEVVRVADVGGLRLRRRDAEREQRQADDDGDAERDQPTVSRGEVHRVSLPLPFAGAKVVRQMRPAARRTRCGVMIPARRSLRWQRRRSGGLQLPGRPRAAPGGGRGRMLALRSRPARPRVARRGQPSAEQIHGMESAMTPAPSQKYSATGEHSGGEPARRPRRRASACGSTRGGPPSASPHVAGTSPPRACPRLARRSRRRWG